MVHKHELFAIVLICKNMKRHKLKLSQTASATLSISKNSETRQQQKPRLINCLSLNISTARCPWCQFNVSPTVYFVFTENKEKRPHNTIKHKTFHAIPIVRLPYKKVGLVTDSQILLKWIKSKFYG